MKKTLTIFLTIISFTLLGASCNKSNQQADNSQITIPVVLTEKNVKKAIDAASKELNWPYTYRKPVEGTKIWFLEQRTEAQGHALNQMLFASKISVDWAERNQELCGSTTTQLSLNSPQEGLACLVINKNVEGHSRALIIISIKDHWEIRAMTFGNSFSDVKPILDHFLNNLE
jgi:hypothetical protein